MHTDEFPGITAAPVPPSAEVLLALRARAEQRRHQVAQATGRGCPKRSSG